MSRIYETLSDKTQQSKQEVTTVAPSVPEEWRDDLAKLEQAARLNSRATFHGDILKFIKGKWGVGFGEARRWVPDGSQWVVILSESGHGWRTFETMLDEDGHEVTRPRYIVGRITEFVPPARNELGDLDQSQWRIGLSGRPEDPWKPIVSLLLVSLDGETAMTFITDSPTGVDRTWAFIEDAARAAKRHPGQDPAIALKAGGFTSRKNKNVWVDTPGFELTGQWVGRRDPGLLPQGGGGGDGKGDSEPPNYEQVPLEAYDDR